MISDTCIDADGEVGSDFVISQRWRDYTPDEHARWRTLFARQAKILVDRAAPQFLHGVEGFDMASGGIPEFGRLNVILQQRTGWSIVAVPGLVPDEVFFEHLANKRFPATRFIRRADQMDYIQEPDVFHDIFGHVPMLLNPVFADFMQAYGRAGLKAMGVGCLENLARLYWYTVEFGLTRTRQGLRIYGSGIVSSRGEVIYCLEDATPNRVLFDAVRVMRTNYRIDAYQEIYFVINAYEDLFAALKSGMRSRFTAANDMRCLKPSDHARDDIAVSRNAVREGG
ncbi:MAG: phenylalanine 4-monooxygenase [Magnetovibrio sp.]|nr:phenylalanine 4-monooxygenase [Magnetovibrio sp.]